VEQKTKEETDGEVKVGNFLLRTKGAGLRACRLVAQAGVLLARADLIPLHRNLPSWPFSFHSLSAYSEVFFVLTPPVAVN